MRATGDGSDGHSPLLVTKIGQPRPISEALSRTLLEERVLTALAGGRCCAIVAPAGSGKTTLVNQALQRWPHEAVWLRLDSGDDSPAMFWRYVLAALRTAHPELLADVPCTDHWLVTLIEALSTISQPLTLVLNDLHHITVSSIYDDLLVLLEHPPPALRLMLVSQRALSLPVPRLRISHHLEYLTRQDLFFSVDETTAFLRETMAWPVSDETVRALADRTGGWPAALRMAALRLRTREDGEALAARFGGTSRSVMRYLDDEVFGRLPEAEQIFLLQTASLERLTPAACAVVTGQTDSGSMLEELTHTYLLAQRMHEPGTVYCYPVLLRDYLRERVRRDRPEWLAEMHRQAAAHYREAGSTDAAVDHLLAAGDEDAVLALIRQQGRKLISAGDLDTLTRWVEGLTGERLWRDGRVCLYYAWALLLRGDLQRVEPLLRRATMALDDNSMLQPSDERMIPGEIAVIRARLGQLFGDPQAASTCAQVALRELPTDEVMLRGLALMILGQTMWLNGDLAAAEDVFSEGLAAEPGEQGEQVRLAAECNLAYLHGLRGELRQASDRYAAVLAVTRNLPEMALVAGVARVGLGGLKYTWNRLDEAATLIREGLTEVQPWLHLSAVLPGYLLLAQVEVLRGRLRAAQCALKTFEAHSERGRSPLLRQMLVMQQARLRLLAGDAVGGLHWLRSAGLHEDDKLLPESAMVYLTLAEALTAAGDATSSALLLDRLEQMADERAWHWLGLELRLARAVALWSSGQQDEALALVRQALVVAEPERHIRVFVDRGAVMEQMLRHSGMVADPLSYGREVLRAFEDDMGRTDEIALDLSARRSPSRILTAREQEVLELLAQGLSNDEIAGHLVVSVGTVKTHLKRIYRKLNSRNRTQVIVLAREKGLLDA